MASTNSDPASVHALTMATLTLPDEELADLCGTNDDTMQYCQNTPAIAERLDNARAAGRTGRSPVTTAGSERVLSRGSSNTTKEYLASIDDQGFLEVAESSDKAATLVASDPFLSIRLNKLDPSLAQSIGATPPVARPSSLTTGRTGGRSGSVPARRSAVVERDEEGNVILTGNRAEDAAILSNLSQEELNEYAEDENVAEVLRSPEYRSVARSPVRTATRPLSPVRSAARPLSPGRTVPRSLSPTRTSILPLRSTSSPARSGVLPLRSASPPRKPFSTSANVRTSPQPTMLSPSRVGRVSGSPYSLNLTYDKTEDARLLSKYPKEEVMQLAQSDPYVASVIKSPAYKGSTQGSVVGTCQLQYTGY